MDLNKKIEEMIFLQQQVDNAIFNRFNINPTEQRQDIIASLLLSLKVELGELANETRCFKHWSAKGPADPPVILEEFADNMAFVLSIGLICGHVIERDIGKRLYYAVTFGEPTKQELTKQFNRVFKAVNAFENSGQAFAMYLVLFQEVLNLASALGFSFTNILDAYLEKSAINLVRQREGY